MQLDEKLEQLRRKTFPRVPWTEDGPVRRQYLTKPVDGSPSAQEALAALAERAGFTAPDAKSVIGDAAHTWEAFRQRAEGGGTVMIFGTSPEAFWCDAACCPADPDGWQRTIIRTEEGENLVALSHIEGVLRFRRAE